MRTTAVIRIRRPAAAAGLLPPVLNLGT
eukprot:SAG31_NODE_3299_length_4445_cov_3.190520_7_plen_27_part_01